MSRPRRRCQSVPGSLNRECRPPIRTSTSTSAKTRSLGPGIRRHQPTRGCFLSYMGISSGTCEYELGGLTPSPCDDRLRVSLPSLGHEPPVSPRPSESTGSAAQAGEAGVVQKLIALDEGRDDLAPLSDMGLGDGTEPARGTGEVGNPPRVDAH